MAEYDPTEEVDPEQLARDHLKLGREILEEIKKGRQPPLPAPCPPPNEQLAALRARIEAQQPMEAYEPPSFEELLSELARKWTIVEKTFKGAPLEVQALVFQMLAHSRLGELRAPMVARARMELRGVPCGLMAPAEGAIPAPEPGSGGGKGPSDAPEGETA
jgi:hypothetical protein